MTRTIFKSKFADIDIPLIDLPAFFFGKVRQHAEFACTDSPRQLLIDGTEGSTESLTLGQVEEMTERLASGLYNKLGVRQGDVLAVVLPSSIYYPVVVLAALMVGATCTLANPAYTSGELAHQLEDSGSKFVIATRALLPVIAGASEGQHTEGSTPAISLEHHTLIVEGPLAQTGATGDNAAVRSIFDILSDSYYPRAHLTTFEALSATTALIPYSSGTTGLPKGVKLSHYNLVANLLQVGLVLGQMTSAKYPRTSMGILPMFHSFGMVAVALGMPTCGSSLVVMPKFEMAQFLSLVQKHRATDAMLVPPIINALVKLPMVRKYDLSSMSWIVCGAAPLSTSTIIALETLFDGISVMQGYGLTETSPGISINSPHIKNTDSSGPLLPNIEAIVIDDLGRALGTDEVGELCFRGPNVMTGYLNNDQATRETIDSDGFLHTGDIGYIDEDGYVYVTDRKKELIKFNGFQVAPAELEGILMQHPRVRDCAVFGVYDKSRQTEVPKAHLVLTADDKLDIQEPDDVAHRVVEWMNEQVAYYKHLRGGYVVVDAIPKSASGKILRRFLK